MAMRPSDARKRARHFLERLSALTADTDVVLESGCGCCGGLHIVVHVRDQWGGKYTTTALTTNNTLIVDDHIEFTNLEFKYKERKKT